MNALRRIVVGLSLLACGPAWAAPAPCSITVSGAVTGTFRCEARAEPWHGSGLRLSFTPRGLPRSVKAFLGGPLELSSAAPGQVHSGGEMERGRLGVTGPRHASYLATAGKKASGDIRLLLSTARVSEHEAAVSGTLDAVLVPAGAKGGKTVRLHLAF